MKYRNKAIGAVLLLLMASACNPTGGRTDAEAVARRWAEAYFNYDYRQALTLTEPEDQRWLRFIASNMTEQDVAAVNAAEAAEVQSAEVYEGSDTTATAYITVSNFLEPDSIGGSLRHVAQAQFEVPMVKRSGSWKVRMAVPPRSGMRSHD